MLHPSYSDLMKVVNSEVEPGEAPVVNSRYSIVMATSKRARQLISGEDALIDDYKIKPLSMAVEELNQGKIKILTEDEARRTREEMAARPPAAEAADTETSGDEDNTAEAEGAPDEKAAEITEE